MKYSQSHRTRKFGAGFYLVIALCLLIIGGAAWFALSRNSDNSGTTVPKTPNSSDEYSNNDSSYNESIPEIIPDDNTATETANPESDVPYSSEETVFDESTAISFTMPVQGDVIKEHSLTQLQYSATYGDMRVHSGIDIACDEGTSVGACGDGTVKSIEQSATLGNTVTIEHAGGITVKYSALENVQIKEGSAVKMGDIIGAVTTVPSECNDKSHLHIEAFADGEAVEPLEALGLK